MLLKMKNWKLKVKKVLGGSLVPWLVVGLAIRLFLMANALHPDIRGYNLGAYLISQQGQVLHFYDYISQLPEGNHWKQLYGDDLFIYPPIPYLVTGGVMKLLSWAYPWETFRQLIDDMGLVVDDPSLPGLMVLLKLPFLVFDLVGLWLVGKYFEKNKRKKRVAQVAWIFNLPLIYASYMVAQFDVMIAVVILGALVLGLKKRWVWAGVVLGLGTGVKLFPIFLLPLVAFAAGERLGERVKVVAAGVGTYLAVILPYVLGSSGFRQYALLASQTDKIFFAKIPITGAEYLPIFLVGVAGIYWWAFYKAKDKPLWWWMTALMLVFFSVVHFHPQWLVWITPLWVMMLAEGWGTVIYPLAVWLGCYVMFVLSFEPSLNFSLFERLHPAWQGFNFTQWLARYYPPAEFFSIFRGLFAGTSLWVVGSRMGTNGRRGEGKGK
jgi:hypothetical protein